MQSTVPAAQGIDIHAVPISHHAPSAERDSSPKPHRILGLGSPRSLGYLVTTSPTGLAEGERSRTRIRGGWLRRRKCTLTADSQPAKLGSTNMIVAGGFIIGTEKRSAFDIERSTRCAVSRADDQLRVGERP